jgi:hypothetical protein
MLRIFFAVGVLPLFATIAFACDGQTGKVIFEDKFADDTGGWQFGEADGLLFKGPGAIAKTDASNNGYQVTALNQTFTATQGDFCTEGPFPADAAKVNAGIGVVFWGKDYSNYWMANAFANGKVYLTKIANNQAFYIFDTQSTNVVKTGPTDVNSVRAVVKSGTITVIVNGQTVKSVRAQIPSDDLKFGFRHTYWNASPTPV